MTDPTSPVDVVERLEACAARLAEKHPVCPFSQRSPEYLTTDPDKPCHYCGTTQEGPDMCRGIGSDVLDKAEDNLRAAAALIRELEGREKALLEALKPFAISTERDNRSLNDAWQISRNPEITMGDLRRAAKLVAPASPTQENA